MRSVWIAWIAYALLAGCAAAPVERSAPDVEKVLVPVPVEPERHLPVEPAWATEELPIGAEIDAQVSALLAERAQARAHIRQISAVCR